MGADGIAIAFVTPEQGEQLTAIEAYINKQLDIDNVEGFQAYTPKVVTVKAAEAKPHVPLFGRRIRRYSNRV